ncbi:MAG TPA: hypothetical protein VHH72_11075 [Solirubrobacterales bacterium]|jgi:hypothetical protein|nr:hypothetical protein [Solirubrobacterales bacterium]
MPGPWRIRILAVVASTAVLAAGCSRSEPEETPEACLAGSDAYLRALAAAPGEVRLAGDTPISGCLVPEQEGADLARVGQEMIKAATDLNAAARQDPTGPASVQLGYLIGAVERGAEGIHTDLKRRLSSAARFSPGGLLPAEFERTFGRGYSAGLESG